MIKSSGSRQKVISNSHTTIWSVPVSYNEVEMKEPFIVVEKKDAVTVIVKNELNKFLLVKQHRFVCNQTGWELPQGAIEDNETIFEAAKRELLEETGINAVDVGEILGHIYEAGDWCTTRNNIVLFNKFADTDIANAEFQSEWMSIEEIKQLSKNGEIIDSPSLAALCLSNLFN